MPTSYESSHQPIIPAIFTAACSEVATTPTNLAPSEDTPTITLNDQKSFVWPSGGLTNFQNTNTFLRQLQNILTSQDVEGFAVNVNRAVKCLFSNKVEIVGTFVIQGETGSKKHVDNGSLTGDLYLLDTEDQTKVDMTIINIFTIWSDIKWGSNSSFINSITFTTQIIFTG